MSVLNRIKTGELSLPFRIEDTVDWDSGRAALEKSYKEFYRAMPDWRAEFPSIMYSGDTIIFEGVAHVTFTGPMTTPEGEVAPTGKSLNARFADFYKISPDGLIVEDRTYFDNLDFMKQLGLMK